MAVIDRWAHTENLHVQEISRNGRQYGKEAAILLVLVLQRPRYPEIMVLDKSLIGKDSLSLVSRLGCNMVLVDHEFGTDGRTLKKLLNGGCAHLSRTATHPQTATHPYVAVWD